MMHNSQTHSELEQGPVAIRALRSLNCSHMDAVRAGVAACGGEWLVEGHYDYDGYLFIIVTKHSGTDDLTFLISGRLGHIELSQMSGDLLRPLEAFEVVEQVVTELVGLCSCSMNGTVNLLDGGRDRPAGARPPA